MPFLRAILIWKGHAPGQVVEIVALQS